MLSRRGASAPGRLRQLLALERAMETPDGAGGATLSWNEIAGLWAEVTPVRADERGVGGGLGDLVLHRIAIRRRADIQSSDRLRFGDRVFRIRSLGDPAEDGRYLVLTCEEEGEA